jgi:hypothetical protein
MRGNVFLVHGDALVNGGSELKGTRQMGEDVMRVRLVTRREDYQIYVGQGGGS